MRLYSYVVNHDSGFAPNPFWGYCTLANCKPAIRRTAKVGDWIVGLSDKASGNKMIYAMKVQEILPFNEYFNGKRFQRKKPDFSLGSKIRKVGDNIYKPLPGGKFRQLRSMHSKPKCRIEDPKSKAHDLSGKNVLISKEFFYFGKNARTLPTNLNELKVGRGHKNNFTEKLIKNFRLFIKKQRKGVNAEPGEWKPRGCLV